MYVASHSRLKIIEKYVNDQVSDIFMRRYSSIKSLNTNNNSSTYLVWNICHLEVGLQPVKENFIELFEM